jgi:hypothetical protein
MSADYCTTTPSKGLKRSPGSAQRRSFDVEVGPASRGDDRARLALILPRHRLWEWHRQLLLHLVKSYDVAVFLDDRAPPYPRAERLWLKLEQLVFPSGALPKRIAPEDGWGPVSKFENVSGRIVINLSECSHSHGGALELRYDGVPDSCALIDRLLAQRSPNLAVHCTSTDGTLAASRVAIEKKFLIASGLQASFSRCVSLIDRALCSTAGQPAGEGTAAAAPASGTLTEFVPRMIARKVSNLVMKPFQRREHWQVALRNGAGAFNVVQDDGARFYADPFLHRANGRTFLFVEEYPYADRRGVISVAEVAGDRLLTAPVPVLRRPYHLSYPFVFQHEGEFYMIPETGENRSIELYRAVEFPWKWELSTVLMKGAVFSDATILFHDGLWWLFVTADWFGTSTQDQLSIFYSESLQGDWKPHPANPVKWDSRFSRPAGRIVQQSGRLFRPAQNCDRTYGAGIVWFEITELTSTHFSERRMADWDGQAELSMDGLHSFDQLGSLQVIDFKCSVGRGAMRGNISTVKPTDGGELELSLSGASPSLQLTQVQPARQ